MRERWNEKVTTTTRVAFIQTTAKVDVDETLQPTAAQTDVKEKVAALQKYESAKVSERKRSFTGLSSGCTPFSHRLERRGKVEKVRESAGVAFFWQKVCTVGALLRLLLPMHLLSTSPAMIRQKQLSDGVWRKHTAAVQGCCAKSASRQSEVEIEDCRELFKFCYFGTCKTILNDSAQAYSI